MSNNIKFNNIDIKDGKVRLSEREISNILKTYLINKGIPVNDIKYVIGFIEQDIGPVLNTAVVDVDTDKLYEEHKWTPWAQA